MTEPAEETDDGPRQLDVDHVADLANLPLDDDEHDELEQACEEVLEAFQLPDVEEPEDDQPDLTLFDDEPEAWPEPGVAAIHAAFPETDEKELVP